MTGANRCPGETGFAWQTKVFELLLAAEKIDQPTVDQMRCWPRSGFSVDNSVYLSARDTAGLQQLAKHQMEQRPCGVRYGRGRFLPPPVP